MMNRQVKEGMKAFKEGNIGNPYRQETKKNKDWEYGFNRSYFDNLRAVKEKESA